MPDKIKTAILTVSTLGSQGKREDTSGETIRELLASSHSEIVDYQIVSDDLGRIKAELVRMVERSKADLIVTTGGTGLSPTDVTPEATLTVIERRVPGMEEVMRRVGVEKTPYAMLSRGVVGIRAKTLIVNLPGNPKGVRENLQAILPVLPHAIQILKGTQVSDSGHDYPGD